MTSWNLSVALEARTVVPTMPTTPPTKSTLGETALPRRTVRPMGCVIRFGIANFIRVLLELLVLAQDDVVLRLDQSVVAEVMESRVRHVVNIGIVQDVRCRTPLETPRPYRYLE